MGGFTSALALRPPSLLVYSDESFDSINNPPTDPKDRVKQVAEEEDALQQISDFLAHSCYDSNDNEWRLRVSVRDLLDEEALTIEDQGEVALTRCIHCLRDYSN